MSANYRLRWQPVSSGFEAQVEHSTGVWKGFVCCRQDARATAYITCPNGDQARAAFAFKNTNEAKKWIRRELNLLIWQMEKGQ